MSVQSSRPSTRTMPELMEHEEWGCLTLSDALSLLRCTQDGVTPEVVDAYRLPQLVRGWERGMVAFLRGRVTAGQPFGARLAAAYHGREHMTQVEKLLDAVTQQSIKVLPSSVPVGIRLCSSRLLSYLPWPHGVGLGVC